MNLVDVIIDGSGPHLDRFFTYQLPEEYACDVIKGSYVWLPWGKATRGGFVAKVHDRAPDDLKIEDIRFVLGVYSPGPLVSATGWDLAAWMKSFYFASWPAVLQALIPGPVLQQARGWFKTKAKRTSLRAWTCDEPRARSDDRPTLTRAQQAVWNELRSELGTGSTLLLDGVTGSGKTEIYLRACEETLQRGREVLVLVPEVALTPQARHRFESRFGAGVCIIHSGLTAAQRRHHWWQARRGEARLVVGTRSAVFAPLEHLGLIIIDEEHDSSYKQHQDVLYHARQVAAWLAKKHGANLLLGSATPCLESYYLALIGRYRLLTLDQRVGGQPMPELELVEGGGLPRRVLTALERVREKGEQSVVLLNRRGFARYLLCGDCGWVPECRHCSIAMTYHRQISRLVCHYCGFCRLVPDVCEQCGGRKLDLPGLGTERVEAELGVNLPELRVVRLDRDTVKGRSENFERVFHAFAKRQFDTLLGTQMISKGLDFPLVSLVVVLEADTGLHLPDFRAAERTFSLLTQVAGRAGRGAILGKVMIVCRHPKHSLFRDLIDNRREEFLQAELEVRKQLGYPPFCRILRIVASHKQEVVVQEFVEDLATRLIDAGRTLGLSVQVLGASPCPVERIQDRYRWHVLLKASKVQELQELVRNVMPIKMPAGLRLSFDQDPMELM